MHLARLLTGCCLAACTRDAPPATSGVTPPVRIQPETLIVWRDSQVVANTRPAFDARSVYFLGVHMAYGVDKIGGALLWTTPLTYPFSTGILQGYGTATAAGRVIIGDVDVFGLDPQSGAIVWRFAPRITFPGERSFQRLTADASTVYCGGVWGNVYAVDAATGAQKWVTHVTTLPDSFIRVFNPVIVNGVVYSAFADTPAGSSQINGGVAAMDAATGRLLWSQYLPRHFPTQPTETQNVAVTAARVVTGAGDGYLYGLDIQSGAIIDTVDRTIFGFPSGTPTGGFFSLAAVDTVVVVGVTNGTFLALDARNLHRKLWTGTLNYGSIVDLTSDSARVYTAYLGGQFGVTDLATGKAVWWADRFDLRHTGEYIGWGPAVDGSRIYVGADQDGYAFKWR